jgi:hypothetical protein
MKALLTVALLAITVKPALAQYPNNPKILIYDQNDKEHCREFFNDGTRFIGMFDGPLSVAVSVPVNHGHGKFSVYVIVAQQGPGVAEVIPSDFSAWYTDPPHTRFPYLDRDAEIDDEAKRSTIAAVIIAGMGGAAAAQPVQATVHNSNGTSSTVTYTDPTAQQRANEQAAKLIDDSRRSEASDRNGILHRNTIPDGHSVEGLVFFKKPHSSPLKVGSKDHLFAVDIPINGVVYRFQ